MLGIWLIGDIYIFFALILTIVGISVFIKRRKANSFLKKGKERFFGLLSEKFESDLIVDKDDILFLLNSINREYNINLSIVSILEDYIVFITKIENITNVNDVHTLIKTIIAIENQERPFRNVPDEERRILKNINDNVKNKCLAPINSDLQELSSIIAIRNKDYERTKNINKWSLPVAIIGTIVAVVFGILSFRSIDYNRIENSIKSAIESSIGN